MGWALLLALLAIVAALVILPLGVEFARAEGRKQWWAIVAGIHIPIPPRLITKVSQKARARQQKPRPRKKARPGRAKERLQEFLRAAAEEPGTSPHKLELADLRVAYRYLRRTLKAVRLRVHRFDAVVATPDPAMTGVAYGWACAAAAWLPAAWPVSVAVDFGRTQPDVALRVELSVIPYKLIAVGISILSKYLRFKLRRRRRYS